MKSEYINNDTLRNIIANHKLMHKDIVKLLSSKYGDISIRTVESWTQDRRVIPGQTLELLIIKLKGATKVQQDHS